MKWCSVEARGRANQTGGKYRWRGSCHTKWSTICERTSSSSHLFHPFSVANWVEQRGLNELRVEVKHIRRGRFIHSPPLQGRLPCRRQISTKESEKQTCILGYAAAPLWPCTAWERMKMMDVSMADYLFSTVKLKALNKRRRCGPDESV